MLINQIHIQVRNKLIWLFLIVVMTLSFSYNIFNRNDGGFFEHFQKDSESLVIGKILADKFRVETGNFGLGFLHDKKSNNVIMESYDIYREIMPITVSNLVYDQYKSQYGLQGRMFSFLYNKLHIKSIELFRIISAITLSLILVSICYLLKEHFGIMFSIVFYIVFLFSPWIVSFARNLYWIPFSWYLPMLVSLLIVRNNNNCIYTRYLPLMFFTVLFKCLCGYEYITTIMLSSVSIPIILCFTTTGDKYRKKIVMSILMIGITSILACISALLIHSNIRGDSIIKGLHAIYNEDFLRRMVGGNPENFPQVLKDSINASIFCVIKKYFNWHDINITRFINGKLFLTICYLAFCISTYNFIKFRVFKKNIEDQYGLIMYTVFLCTTVSWFIIGKAHSYIHTHMNFVLWYFGFIQCIFYIILKFLFDRTKSIINRIK